MALARGSRNYCTSHKVQTNRGEDSKVEYVEQMVSHLGIEHMLVNDHYSTSALTDLYYFLHNDIVQVKY
jgi:predicted RecB family endonuclease